VAKDSKTPKTSTPKEPPKPIRPNTTVKIREGEKNRGDRRNTL